MSRDEVAAMAGKFTTFRDDLLIALARAAEKDTTQYLDPQTVAVGAGLNYLVGWVRNAVQSLENSGLVKVSYTMGGGPDGGMDVTVTGEGWEESERLLEERGDGTQDQVREAPASDRYVHLDHNASEYRVAVSKLNDVIEGVRGHNEYADSEPEDHQQRVAELESGRRLLEAVRVRVEPVRVLLLDALKYIGHKFADHAIGILAAAAITAIAALLDLPL